MHSRSIPNQNSVKAVQREPEDWRKRFVEQMCLKLGVKRLREW